MVPVTSALSRYFLPSGKPILLDADGFLLTPDHPDWGVDVPQSVTALDVLGSRVVVLAAGGAGKTETCKALAEFEQAEYVNAAPLEREDFRRRIAKAVERGSVVYLDGLDQAALRDPMLLQWLADELTRGEAATISWRLACRAIAWEQAFSDAGFVESTLLPLDRVTAEALVSEVGCDGVSFISALVAAGRGGLSACVGQLLAEVRFWRDEGVLPEQSQDALIYEIDVLLQETNSAHRPVMPHDRKKRLVKRLGAFAAFSGAQRLSPAPTGNKGTLSADLLPSVPEPDEPGRPVEPADYREVMDSPLFMDGKPGTLMFRHQRYVEYLAAAYLIERNVDVAQVPALLGVRESGVLPSTRIGQAAWLAALAPELVTTIIKDNALLFARASATVELPADATRAAVVRGLLESASRDEHGTEWGLDLAGLAYPGLDSVLQERLGDVRTAAELWWVGRLAAAGECTSVASLLAAAAQDTRWPAFARRTAAVSAAELGDDEVRLSLQGLLEPEAGDPDNQIFSTAVDILYPDLLTTQRLTQVMRPHQAPLVGNYLLRTLRTLPTRIPESDLAEFLTWFAAQDDHDDYGDLFAGLVNRACRSLDDLAIRKALAQLIVSGFDSGQWYSSVSSAPTRSWVDEPDPLRRALACAVAALGETAWLPVIYLELLTPADLEWLQGELVAGAPDATGALSTCVDRLQTMQHQMPFDYIDVSQSVQATTDDELAAAVRRLEVDPLSWPDMVSVLLNEPGVRFGADLTESANWARLTASQRTTLIHAGVRYLAEYEPNPRLWCAAARRQWDQVLPDWSGIWFMEMLVQLDSRELAELAAGIWERWAHCVVAVPLRGEDREPTLRAQLIQVGLNRARDHIVRAALAHLDELVAEGRGLAPQITYECLVVDLGSRFAEVVLSEKADTILAGALLGVLAQGAPALATTVCRQLLDRAGPLVEHAWEQMKALDPNYVIDRLGHDDVRVERIIATVDDLDIGKLDPSHLTEAARLLLGAIPFEADRPLDLGGAVTAEAKAQFARERVLGRLVANGQVDDLIALHAGRSELAQGIIARYVRQAESRRADLDVPLVGPAALLGLLARGDARLVRNDADLVEVLLRHYDRLQHYLHHSDGWREIWSGDLPRGEDDISDWASHKGQDWLGSGQIVVDRELQVARPKGGGIGTRVDLTATSVTVDGGLARVSIEAKLVNNAELDTAMEEQLVNRYLVPLRRRHGIFIVYWVAPAHRPKSWSGQAGDKETLLQKLRQQAEQLAKQGFRITPYVLDIGPAGAVSSQKA